MLESYADWKTDYDQATGKYGEWYISESGLLKSNVESTQYSMAVSLAKKYNSEWWNFGNDFAILGHSLGGGLATVASMATGAPAFTFNSAAVHPGTIHSLGLDNASTTQITNYVNQGEIVNAYQESQGLSLQGRTIPVNVGGSGLGFFGSINRHSIENFVQSWSR